MSTTQDDIRRWLATAQEKGSTHLIVVVDTFDHEDYPVYVRARDQADLDREIDEHSKNMQRVMEVYAMHLPIEDQIREYRANHRVMAPPKA